MRRENADGASRVPARLTAEGYRDGHVATLHARLLAMQRKAGNAAVTSLLQSVSSDCPEPLVNREVVAADPGMPRDCREISQIDGSMAGLTASVQRSGSSRFDADPTTHVQLRAIQRAPTTVSDESAPTADSDKSLVEIYNRMAQQKTFRDLAAAVKRRRKEALERPRMEGVKLEEVKRRRMEEEKRRRKEGDPVREETDHEEKRLEVRLVYGEKTKYDENKHEISIWTGEPNKQFSLMYMMHFAHDGKSRQEADQSIEKLSFNRRSRKKIKPYREDVYLLARAWATWVNERETYARYVFMYRERMPKSKRTMALGGANFADVIAKANKNLSPLTKQILDRMVKDKHSELEIKEEELIAFTAELDKREREGTADAAPAASKPAVTGIAKEKHLQLKDRRKNPFLDANILKVIIFTTANSSKNSTAPNYLDRIPEEADETDVDRIPKETDVDRIPEVTDVDRVPEETDETDVDRRGALGFRTTKVRRKRKFQVPNPSEAIPSKPDPLALTDLSKETLSEQTLSEKIRSNLDDRVLDSGNSARRKRRGGP